MGTSSSLSGQTALVTGGAVRLGRAIVETLAEAGCGVAIHYGSSGERAESLAHQIRASGGRAVALEADLRSSGDVDSLMPRAVKALGSLDILVNNAAVFPDGNLSETSLDLYERVLSVNLRAPFFLCRAFAQAAAGRGGQIVNLVDARIDRGGADHAAYRVAKAGVAQLTRDLALALAPEIRVNAVAPGAALAAAGEGSEQLEELVARQVPLRRAGGARSVAEAVRFLLEQEFVTGQILRVDGGQFL